MSLMDARREIRDDLDWMISNGLIGIDTVNDTLNAVFDRNRDWYDAVLCPPPTDAGRILLAVKTDGRGFVVRYRLVRYCSAMIGTPQDDSENVKGVWKDILGNEIHPLGITYWTPVYNGDTDENN